MPHEAPQVSIPDMLELMASYADEICDQTRGDPDAKAAVVAGLANVLADAIARLNEEGVGDLEKLLAKTCEHVARRAMKEHFRRRMASEVAA